VTFVVSPPIWLVAPGQYVTPIVNYTAASLHLGMSDIPAKCKLQSVLGHGLDFESWSVVSACLHLEAVTFN
jgi:hypothetical protein